MCCRGDIRASTRTDLDTLQSDERLRSFCELERLIFICHQPVLHRQYSTTKQRLWSF